MLKTVSLDLCCRADPDLGGTCGCSTRWDGLVVGRATPRASRRQRRKKNDPAAVQHSPSLANQFSHRSKDAEDTAEKGNTYAIRRARNVLRSRSLRLHGWDPVFFQCFSMISWFSLWLYGSMMVPWWLPVAACCGRSGLWPIPVEFWLTGVTDSG